MGYVTYTEFGAYTNTSIPTEEFDVLNERASEIIDDYTFYRVNVKGLSEFTTFQQEQFKKAVMAQIEFMYLNGGVDSYTGNDSINQGFTIGKFSLNGTNQNSNSNANIEYLNGLPIAPMVRRYLRPTGLLYSGVCRFNSASNTQ